MKRIGTVLFNLVAFSVGLILGCKLLSKAYPMFDGGIIRQKLAFFEQHRDEYDTLFLGSSRVYRHVSPALFDQMSREAGMPTRSFNIGVDALFPPEDSYMAEQLFATRPKKLRWVFVEVSMFLPPFAEKSPEAPRSIYWHDWPRTRMAFRHILDESKAFEWSKRKKRWRDWQASWTRCVLHFDMFARNSTNFGRGTAGLKSILNRKSPDTQQPLGDKEDGYVPLFRPEGMYPSDLKEYETLLAERSGKPVPYDVLGRAGQENLDRLLKLIHQVGATPVLVVAPALSPMVFVPRKPAKELYLDFSDVDAWPELYLKEHRADTGHLTKSGAEIYTRYLAEGWLAACGAKRKEKSEAVLQTTSALDARASTP